MCFSDEMFRWINKFVRMPMVRCIKFRVNMANFICEFLEVFCFSSAIRKPISRFVARSTAVQSQMFFKIYAKLIKLQNIDFLYFLGTFSNLAPAFFQFTTKTWLTLRTLIRVMLKTFLHLLLQFKLSVLLFC